MYFSKINDTVLFQGMLVSIQSHFSNQFCLKSLRQFWRMDVKSLHGDGTALFEDKLFSKDPIKLFGHWYDAAKNTPGLSLSHAMTLSTVKSDGRPSSRMVLLQGFNDNGFKFYTSNCSSKAKDLKNTPYASLVFYWLPLNRSVRIEGKVEAVPTEEAIEDFDSRPRDRQLSMHVMDKQSLPIESRGVLVERLKAVTEEFDGKTIPKPEFYQGYRVVPESIEFWQGNKSLICDRILFRKNIRHEHGHDGENGWKFIRLGN